MNAPLPCPEPNRDWRTRLHQARRMAHGLGLDWRGLPLSRLVDLIDHTLQQRARGVPELALAGAPLIIGLAGPARSGKDSAADWLVRTHGFTRLALADPLRDMLELGLGLEPRWLQDDKDQPIPWLGVSARRLLQTLGTEWGRKLIHQDLWVLALHRRIQALADETDRLVISDVRFPNEAHWVRQHGALWHIDRRQRPGLSASAAAHSSEIPITLQSGDDCIDNNGSLDQLYANVDESLAALCANRTSPPPPQPKPGA